MADKGYNHFYLNLNKGQYLIKKQVATHNKIKLTNCLLFSFRKTTMFLRRLFTTLLVTISFVDVTSGVGCVLYGKDKRTILISRLKDL